MVIPLAAAPEDVAALVIPWRLSSGPTVSVEFGRPCPPGLLVKLNNVAKEPFGAILKTIPLP
jgi:hypothetical protein